MTAYEIAQNEIGTKEIKGSKHNKRILEYHKYTNLGATDDETPWCSSFVNYCCKQAGIAGTNAANARSWLKWGREIKKPVTGCVVVFKRGKSSWQGHVGFYAGETKTKIKVLGGNQSNQVKYSYYSKSNLLGLRLEKKKYHSTTIATAATTGAIAVAQEALGSLDKLSGIKQQLIDFFPHFATYMPTIVVVGLVIYIIFERNKKIKERGI